jgi:hypothetical protein
MKKDIKQIAKNFSVTLPDDFVESQNSILDSKRELPLRDVLKKIADTIPIWECIELKTIYMEGGLRKIKTNTRLIAKEHHNKETDSYHWELLVSD